MGWFRMYQKNKYGQRETILEWVLFLFLKIFEIRISALQRKLFQETLMNAVLRRYRGKQSSTEMNKKMRPWPAKQDRSRERDWWETTMGCQRGRVVQFRGRLFVALSDFTRPHRRKHRRAGPREGAARAEANAEAGSAAHLLKFF